MKNALIKMGIFTVGAAVGSVVTWKFLSKRIEQHYESVVQNEIESIKDAFSKKDSTVKDVGNDPTEGVETDVNELKTIINGSGYTDSLSDNKEKEEKEEEEESKEMDKPYVISPEEFGERDYPVITLWYYDDGVVTNDNGKIVDNAIELLGGDFADHFGDYEDDPDTVYVRDDYQEIDYEVLKDYREYLRSEEVWE